MQKALWYQASNGTTGNYFDYRFFVKTETETDSSNWSLSEKLLFSSLLHAILPSQASSLG